jgi:hypothetical protein
MKVRLSCFLFANIFILGCGSLVKDVVPPGTPKGYAEFRVTAETGMENVSVAQVVDGKPIKLGLLSSKGRLDFNNYHRLTAAAPVGVATFLVGMEGRNKTNWPIRLNIREGLTNQVEVVVQRLSGVPLSVYDQLVHYLIRFKIDDPAPRGAR